MRTSIIRRFLMTAAAAAALSAILCGFSFRQDYYFTGQPDQVKAIPQVLPGRQKNGLYLAQVRRETDLGTEQVLDYRYHSNGTLAAVYQDDRYVTRYEYLIGPDPVYSVTREGDRLVSELFLKAGRPVREIQYPISMGGDPMGTMVTLYDECGNRTSWQALDFRGNVTDEITGEYKYDSKGRLVTVTETDLDGKIIRRAAYHYYDNGSCRLDTTDYLLPGNGNSTTKEALYFDGNGKLTAIHHYQTEGLSNRYRTRLEYDRDGNLLHTEVRREHDPDDFCTARDYQRVYNRRGQLALYQILETESRKSGGKRVTESEQVLCESLFHYDQSGNLVCYTFDNSDVSPFCSYPPRSEDYVYLPLEQVLAD